MKSGLIDKNDIEILKNIANKYNISTETLGEILIKKNKGKGLTHQIRFSSDEINEIDMRAENLSVTRSRYCRLCINNFFENDKWKSLNVVEVKENSYKFKRDIIIHVSFNNAENYDNLKEMSKKYELSFSSMIRYIVINNAL